MGGIVGGGSIFISNYFKPPKVIIKEIEKEKIVTEVIQKKIVQEYLTRDNINDNLKNTLFLNGYLMLFNNSRRDIIKIIVDTALRLKVPVNLAVALATVESRLNIYATNNTGNASYGNDYGLFQLNSKSFPRVKYFDPKENTLVALSYLKELYDKTGEWNSSIVYYNCGLKSVWAPTSSIKHLALVLEEEKNLDIIFSERMLIWKQM